MQIDIDQEVSEILPVLLTRMERQFASVERALAPPDPALQAGQGVAGDEWVKALPYERTLGFA